MFSSVVLMRNILQQHLVNSYVKEINWLYIAMCYCIGRGRSRILHNIFRTITWNRDNVGPWVSAHTYNKCIFTIYILVYCPVRRKYHTYLAFLYTISYGSVVPFAISAFRIMLSSRLKMKVSQRSQTIIQTFGNRLLVFHLHN